MKRIIYMCILSLGLAGCAGFYRSCSNFNAENFGSNWIVVQFAYDGHVFNCWTLHGVSITNEEGSDGIYWKDSNTSHMVHISGWYNRVQVFGDSYQDFDHAATLLGVSASQCGDGRYPR